MRLILTPRTAFLMRIDDHILAGYISGELSSDERAAVTQALVRDAKLREWLHLATEALAAANAETSPGPKMRLIESNPIPGDRKSADRRSMPPTGHIRRAI